MTVKILQGFLYPSTDVNEKDNSHFVSRKYVRKVRALYDFEAAEENELTFYTGELINVLDDSDSNWWSGSNDRGEGLFPSNFVSADLSVNVEYNHNESQKYIQSHISDKKPQSGEIEIDEVKIDRLLNLLHESNPEDPSQVHFIHLKTYF